jgi:hypothetical protein
MAEDRIERKVINGQLCDVYYDENGEIDLVHCVRNIEHMKWGTKRYANNKQKECIFKEIIECAIQNKL